MRRAMLLWACVAVVAGGAAVGRGMTEEERREYRGKLMEILPKVPAFDEWVKKTDALPPDFDGLAQVNGLPEPLRFMDGREVKAEEWKARKGEILGLFEQYAWGKIPGHPKLGQVEMTEEAGDGYVTRRVVLHFGAEGKGVVHVTLVVPKGEWAAPAGGPYPVLMGPGLVGGIFGSQAPTMLRRGYITASYAGNDGNDDSVALAAAAEPGSDVGTLPRRAWEATLVVDYLATLPEVDLKKVAIFGYSRDGKQATIAGAIDERICAVIAGSTGVGGVTPYRLAGERNQGEGIESTTKMFPDWFSPRLRFFAGREDRLPVDGNLLLAMVAPRPVLMISGYNDEVSNTWGDEQSLASAKKVYDLMGAGEKLGIYRLPGFHGANDLEVCLDFLDIQFGRSSRKWVNRFEFPWDYAAWKGQSEKVDVAGMRDLRGEDLMAGVTTAAEWEKKAGEIRKQAAWMMGEAPPVMAPPTGAGRGFGRGGAGGRGAGRGPAATGRGAGGAAAAGNPGQVAPDVPAWVIQRSLGGTQEFGWFAAEAGETDSRPMVFGQGVRGTLYTPKGTAAGTKLPAVVWLHSYSYPLGYMWVYHRDLHPVLALVKAGYAVLAYDQAGFGSRMKEGGAFMERYPRWSMMGRMVEDARGAVEALGKDAGVDGEHVYLFGYGMGGSVALHTAALEPKVKGVVSVGGFSPMRLDNAGLDGIGRVSVERPILPKLGWFIGNEGKVPYDYDGLIGAIAPRAVMIVAPMLDRDADAGAVREAVGRARKVYEVYGAGEKLGYEEPWDYNRLTTAEEEKVIAWMKKNG